MWRLRYGGEGGIRTDRTCEIARFLSKSKRRIRGKRSKTEVQVQNRYSERAFKSLVSIGRVTCDGPWDFDFKFQPSVDQRLVRELATSRFLAQAER